MMARLRDNVTDTAFTPAEKQRRYRERQRTKPAATARPLADPATKTLRQLQNELSAMKAAVRKQLAEIATLSKEIQSRLPPSKGSKPV